MWLKLFFFYSSCSLKRISLFSFWSLEVRVFDLWWFSDYFFLFYFIINCFRACRKTKLWSVCFCCFSFVYWTNAVCLFSSFFFFPKLVNCTFYGTQKRKLFWSAWWSTWLNWRFDFLISRIKKLLLQTSICVFVVKMWLAAFSFFYPTLGLPLKCRRSFHARFLKKKKKSATFFRPRIVRAQLPGLFSPHFFCFHFWGATSHTFSLVQLEASLYLPGGLTPPPVLQKLHSFCGIVDFAGE